MNLLPGKEVHMMEKIRCKDKLVEIRDREKKKGLWEERRDREKKERCRSWFRLEIIYIFFYFFRVMVKPVRFNRFQAFETEIKPEIILDFLIG